MKLYGKLKIGDILQFTQEDGNQLILYVGPDGFAIKADPYGTKLLVKEDGGYWVSVRSVEKRAMTQDQG